MRPVISKVPRHIGLILDGNRRFAKKLMLKPWKGHEWGKKKLEKVLEWCSEINLKELTVYAFSVENINRPKEELDHLMKIFKNAYDDVANDPRINERGIKINFIGHTYLFPKDVQESMKNLMEKTKNNKKHIVNFAMAYGGRDEIVDATRKIAEMVKDGKLDPKDIDKKTVSDNLYVKSEPDMIIRTGGEKRSSNFLCYQSAYSEWFYLEKMWPEFEKEDFLECLKEYSKRKRKFGR
ncbi:MAG: polyprenyl diphosphate synthase [Nanoarchaeota archaeon]|nr:polyprenyl diphosphate synthase [Nanoarchaeota archaeon]